MQNKTNLSQDVAPEIAQAFAQFTLPIDLRIPALREKIGHADSTREYSRLLETLITTANPQADLQEDELIAAFTLLANTTERDDLGGLTPTQVMEWGKEREESAPTVPIEIRSCRATHDAVVFLRELQDSPPHLTQVRRELSRKFIYAVNAKLERPDVLDQLFGEKMYKLSSEFEARTVWWLHALTDLGGLARVYKGKYIITKRGERFLSKDSHSQLEDLVHIWSEQLDWESLLNWRRVLPGIQEHQHIITFRLLAVLDLKGVLSVEVADTILRATVEYRSNQIEQPPHSDVANSMILRWWEYFGFISIVKIYEQYGREYPESYRLTGLGRYFLRKMIGG